MSFCLITSRAPVLDLIDYTTYTHRDVDRLSSEEGLALLRKIGLQGSDEALAKVVQDWDGHALTLSLLGAYLVDRYEGKVEHISDIPAPNSDEPLYERVRRVLHRYDEHLTDAERAFLTIFSAFRLPVKKSAFAAVFQAKTGSNTLKKPIAALNDTTFSEMVERLVNYRILRQLQENCYTTHPLIRSHYLARLTEREQASVRTVHQQIADYYLDLAGKMPKKPTLEDLVPLIEVVHHLCHAGAYDVAYKVWRERIEQHNSFVLGRQLSAHETMLALMQEFFPNSDTSQELQVSKSKSKGFILNQVGSCLMILGRLSEAPPFYERCNAVTLSRKDWHNASRSYWNLADLYIYLGKLATSAEASNKALLLARRANDRKNERTALTRQAYISHMQGNIEKAAEAFQQAEGLEWTINPNNRYLYSHRGIQHADHLLRTTDIDYARRVTEANLKICSRYGWLAELSLCYRVLGDVDADAGKSQSAHEHYNPHSADVG